MDTLLLQMGQRLADRRKQLKLTQEQVAELADLTNQTISTAETGRKALRPENIIKLCDTLGISTEYLLRGKISGEDISLLSEKLSKLTPEQYRRLESIIDTFVEAVTAAENEA